MNRPWEQDTHNSVPEYGSGIHPSSERANEHHGTPICNIISNDGSGTGRPQTSGTASDLGHPL